MFVRSGCDSLPAIVAAGQKEMVSSAPTIVTHTQDELVSQAHAARSVPIYVEPRIVFDLLRKTAY